jgi:hypothetical protein
MSSNFPNAIAICIVEVTERRKGKKKNKGKKKKLFGKFGELFRFRSQSDYGAYYAYLPSNQWCIRTVMELKSANNKEKTHAM